MEVDAPQFAAVVPVASPTGRRGTLEVVGSGVVTRIAGDGQLLSAAHVFDKLETHRLFVPGPEGRFVPVTGDVFCSEVPDGDREKDLMDIGYVRLGLASDLKIDPRVTPLNEHDLATDIREDSGPNVYTFVGFPWRKSKTRGNGISPDRMTRTGTCLNAVELRRHGLDPRKHIAINCHRRKSSFGSIERKTAPLPDGMSGGGIFVLPKQILSLSVVSIDLRLAGIAHTYLKAECLMVGTRIDWLVNAILNNQANSNESIGERRLIS